MGQKKPVGILVIDGDRELRAFYNSAFAKAGGYEVSTAATGQEALDLLGKSAEGVLSMMILDWEIQDPTAFILIQKIRQEPKFDSIDIIITSQSLTPADTFLLGELDIRHTMPRRAGADPLFACIQKVTDEQRGAKPVVPLIRKLQHALHSGNLEDCIAILNDDEVAKEIASSPRFIHCLGEFQILKKEFDEAVSTLHEFLRSHSPEVSETLKCLNTLGKALCLAGKYDEASVVFERLASKSPKNLSHKVFCGDALLGQGETDAAKEKYNEVLEKDPDNKEALVGMGKAHISEGDTDGARSFFERVDGPFESYSLASFFNNRAVTLVRSGKPEGAVEFYENALQFLNKYKPQVQFNLGMAYLRMGRTEEAAKNFEDVLNSEAGADFLSKKKVLQKFREKGAEEFIAEYSSQRSQAPKAV